jgi:hypothetical protein
MGKRDNRSGKQSKKSTSKGGGQKRPRQRSGSRRFVMWSLSVIVIGVAVVGAWTLVRHESPKTVASTPASQPPTTFPLKTPETISPKPVPSPVIATPQLGIPEPEFDFGFVPQNAKISHVFWLYSTGTDTLKILQVSPG